MSLDDICWLKSLRETAGAQSDDARDLSKDIFDYCTETAAWAEKASDLLLDVAGAIDNLIVDIAREETDERG
jgi:hypothetical protein